MEAGDFFEQDAAVNGQMATRVVPDWEGIINRGRLCYSFAIKKRTILFIGP